MKMIAIVEDDVLLNQALSITLQKEGFRVFSALLKLLVTEQVKVLHDKNWLGEAIENLLDNSIQYSYEGSVTIQGQKLEKLKPDELTVFRRRNIS